ncbi:phosphotransferase [Cohnella soli]|uniref:Phosphotransferase n=1 Tax=Cohnella soli TaxID=425005 RepID=A0ABW0HZU5_9BACL
MANSYSKSRIRQIVRRFGLIPLSSDSIASFYRKNAVVRVRTGTGTYAMKPFLRSVLLPSGTMDQMKTAANYVQLLMNCGFNYMPRWLASNTGKLWTLNQGKPFYVTTWINGKRLENHEDFENLGRALASLHITSRDSLPMNGPFYDHIRFWQYRDRLFRRRMTQTKPANRGIRQWRKRFGQSCIQFADRSWTELKSPEIVDLLGRERNRPALIHSDITSLNVIISDEGMPFIIDWDRVKLGSIYAEIASALMNTTQFNPDFMQSLLKGYEELHPLDRTERKLIAALYRLPREAWQATRFPNRTSSRTLLKLTEQSWPLRLKSMDLLEEWTLQAGD